MLLTVLLVRINRRIRRIGTREYVEMKLRCALVKRLFEILNAGVVKIFSTKV